MTQGAGVEQEVDDASSMAERPNGSGHQPPEDEALSSIRRLRTTAFRHPGDAHAWRLLGRALRTKGERLNAAAAFARSVTASLGDTAITAIEELVRKDRLPEAEPRLAERLASDSDDVVALRLYADVASQTGRLVEAERDYRRSIDLCPSYVPARYGLSRLLLRQARLGEASNETERMLAAAPTDTGVRMLKAAVAANVGNHDDAAALYRGLTAELPQQPALWLGLGHSYRTSGRTSEAIAAYRRALEIPGGTAEAYWSLSNLKTYRFDDDDLLRIGALADEATGQQAAYLYFALGQAFDARRDEEHAFKAFARGNAAKRATITHDANRAWRRLEHWSASITPELIAARSGEGNPSSAPIFIVGLPRTGSTLVEQILGSHSLIESTAELPYIDRIASRLARRGLESGQERADLNLNGVDLEALGREYLTATRAHRKTGKPFFIDKTPGNFAHAGLIRLMLPNSRIIDVRRHPLATTWSVFKQLFAHGQPFAYDMKDIAQWYRGYVAAMELFDTTMPGVAHRLSYEDLVSDTETQVRHLLDHVGVAFEHACLVPHQNGNAVRTPSSEQVRQPISRDAIDDWRRYRAHLSPVAGLFDAEPSALEPAVPT